MPAYGAAAAGNLSLAEASWHDRLGGAPQGIQRDWGVKTVLRGRTLSTAGRTMARSVVSPVFTRLEEDCHSITPLSAEGTRGRRGTTLARTLDRIRVRAQRDPSTPGRCGPYSSRQGLQALVRGARRHSALRWHAIVWENRQRLSGKPPSFLSTPESLQPDRCDLCYSTPPAHDGNDCRASAQCV